MRVLLAIAFVACSCAPAAREPGPDAGLGTGTQDAGPSVSDAGAPPPSSVIRNLDPDAPFPGAASPTLLDPDTQTLLAVSPDGRHAIVSNDVLRSCSDNPHSGPPCDPSYDIAFRLVTAGAGSLALGVAGRGAEFSEDGRFLFVSGAGGRFVAHADGTGLRPRMPSLEPLGRWLYWSRSNHDLVRQHDLDDEPSLVLAGADTGGGFVSLDGESMTYCFYSGSCFLQSPIGAPPSPIPAGIEIWDGQGKWLLVLPCTYVELTGKIESVCDSIAPRSYPQRVGDTIAFLSARSDGFDVHVRNVATSNELVFPAASLVGWFRLSLDGRRVVGGTVDPIDPIAPVTLLEAPSSGGPWTILGSNVADWSISDDSRFVGMARCAGQPLISVDGAAGVEVRAPGLDLSGCLAPTFEPSSGFGKAVFWEWDTPPGGLHSVIGNADGSGDWLRLPNGAQCNKWQGHTALCDNNNLYAVRGEQAGLLARGLLPEPWNNYTVAPSIGRVFFVTQAGLWSVDVPP